MKKNKIRELAEIYVRVSRGEMTVESFFLAFRTRFNDEVKSAFNRWAANHSGWETLDWSQIENDPLLSQLLSEQIEQK